MYCFRFLNTCMRKDFKESFATSLVQFIASVVKSQFEYYNCLLNSLCFILISLHYWYTMNTIICMTCLYILFINLLISQMFKYPERSMDFFYCFRILNTCMRKGLKESLATFLVQFIALIVQSQFQSYNFL